MLGHRTLPCPAKVPTDMALPLALIVNELVTNAIKHGGNGCRIVLRDNESGDHLS